MIGRPCGSLEPEPFRLNATAPPLQLFGATTPATHVGGTASTTVAVVHFVFVRPKLSVIFRQIDETLPTTLLSV